jgi:hypothetical protein
MTKDKKEPFLDIPWLKEAAFMTVTAVMAIALIYSMFTNKDSDPCWNTSLSICQVEYIDNSAEAMQTMMANIATATPSVKK